MSDTIGPDGLTDEERAEVDALGLDERDYIRSAARKCACRAPGESVTLTDAELRALLGWVERGAAEDTAQQFGARRFAALIAERDAERAAHAETRAERDRLRAALAYVTERAEQHRATIDAIRARAEEQRGYGYIIEISWRGEP